MTIRRIGIAALAAGMAMAADLKVGSAVAVSGQVVRGSIAVPAGSDAGADIGVAVLQGARPGPVLALVSGSHGTEYASIVAAEDLIGRIDPRELSGTVIVIPLLNRAALLAKMPHLNPIDSKNMNRFYPGKADGTQTERASAAIAREVVGRCDYLIDYHGGDLDENMRRYSYWAQTGNAKLDAASKEMVLAFGLDHIVMQDFRPSAPGPRTGTLTRYAGEQGKPSIAVEAGHAGTVEAGDVASLVDGTLSVMRHLGMLPGKAAAVDHPLWIARANVMTSDTDGLFHPLVVPDAYVQAGQRVGYVSDGLGRTIWEARAPAAGVVLYIAALPSLKKGDTVIDIGELGPER